MFIEKFLSKLVKLTNKFLILPQNSHEKIIERKILCIDIDNRVLGVPVEGSSKSEFP